MRRLSCDLINSKWRHAWISLISFIMIRFYRLHYTRCYIFSYKHRFYISMQSRWLHYHLTAMIQHEVFAMHYECNAALYNIKRVHIFSHMSIHFKIHLNLWTHVYKLYIVTNIICQILAVITYYSAQECTTNGLCHSYKTTQNVRYSLLKLSNYVTC